LYIKYISIFYRLETKNVDLDCTKFQRDLDVIRSFPYTVPVNPLTPGNRSFAIMNTVSQIEQLTITNEIHVPVAVFCLVHLQTLTILRTPFVTQFEIDDNLIINSIPSVIGRLTRLRTLSLKQSPTSYFPSTALATLTSLNTIVIDSCDLVALPSTIALLTGLVTLNLPNNRLVTLPDNIGLLPGLVTLNLPNNRLETLPYNIGSLGKTLTYLDLTNNSIRALPQSVGSLGNLTTMLLSNNPLVSLVPLSGLSKLINLYATNCQVKYIPSNLTSVTNVFLQFNNITDISYLHNLASTRLATLNLANNQIDWMLPEIRRFATTLNSLQINNNSLTYLPTEMFLMTALRTANIANNLFAPDELLTIRNTFRTRLPYCVLTS
jgi:Leucine-rich repeat (LRR) protein